MDREYPEAARSLSHQQDRYAGVWWLNAAGDSAAESWGEVEQGLVTLGDYFVKGLAQAEDRGGAARYALDFLAQGGFSKPWLLIFDNVDNPRVLDVWQPRGKVHVLVTSRIGNWSLGASPIEVDAWELPEAIAFLMRETGRADRSKTQLVELAEALGRLPGDGGEAALHNHRGARRNVVAEFGVQRLAVVAAVTFGIRSRPTGFQPRELIRHLGGADQIAPSHLGAGSLPGATSPTRLPPTRPPAP
jgi:hypothetical protein